MSEQTSCANTSLINVLLVEDHHLTRLGLKVALHRTADIKVIGEASNGEEAIDMAQTLSPNVILMDVGMPVMDGIQAAKQIVANHPAIKIIMLTQHDNDADIMASLAAGASGYCLKDVAPERLYTAIRSVNSGDAWLDSAIASKVLKQYTTERTREGAPSTEFTEHEQNTSNVNFEQKLTSTDVFESQEFDRPAPEPLSPRELEVLKLIVDGFSNQEISDKLVVALATTKTHVHNILNKLAVDDRTQAAVHAMRRGLV